MVFLSSETPQQQKISLKTNQNTQVSPSEKNDFVFSSMVYIEFYTEKSDQVPKGSILDCIISFEEN